jgi:hypothetical protein
MADVIWEHCNNCTGKKQHEILFKKKISWSEKISDDFGIDGADTYELLKCCGCNNVQFRHSNWFSEDFDPSTGQYVLHVKHYPPPSFREKPKWLFAHYLSEHEIFVPEIKDNIENLITEIYIALQNCAPKLALLGIRALLEAIMLDKIGDTGSFKGNINEFQDEGYISIKQMDVLEPVLEAGHAAMHRGYKPDPHEVASLMDITESIIETIYINECRTKNLSQKIPPRKTKKGLTKKST